MSKKTKSEELEIIKPIFIVGVPRSGTTLLYHLLAQHPSVAWFSQKTLKKFLAEDFLQEIYLRRRVFGLRNIPYPIDRFNDRFFSMVETPGEFGNLWSSVFVGDWNPKISEKNLEVLKKTIVNILNEKQKKRFLSKYPKNSMWIPMINKCFPNSKFVHIIRDGRHVVSSMLRRSKENPSKYFGIPLKSSGKKEMNHIEKHATQWMQVIKAIKNSFENLNKDQFIEIRYEDLVQFPNVCLDKITKFCELEKYDYLFNKDDYVFNKNNKDKPNWEFLVLTTIESKNKTHKNDLRIKKIFNTDSKRVELYLINRFL